MHHKLSILLQWNYSRQNYFILIITLNYYYLCIAMRLFRHKLSDRGERICVQMRDLFFSRRVTHASHDNGSWRMSRRQRNDGAVHRTYARISYI